MKYDTLDNNEKNKIEEALIKMMSNFKVAPSEIEIHIPIYLYEKLKERWGTCRVGRENDKD